MSVAGSPAVASETLTPEHVKETLKGVAYPGLTRDLVSFGMVHHVAVCDGRVKIQLALRTTDKTIPERLATAITAALVPLGATTIALEIVPPAVAPVATRHGVSDPWADQVRLARVRHVIAVGAGKGGVGKSTVAVNLALARDGLRAGLLDADIYGPSLPILLGLDDGASKVGMSAEKHIQPPGAHGLPMISFGFFLGEGSPAIWRGPIVSKAVKQFARGVAWPDVDVLVVDFPPGTGDLPLSLAQAVALSGAVIVTQPPRVAAAEARKAAEMFRALRVPILGVVENMSDVFGRGAGKSVASELGVPFLGDVPFDPIVVDEGDRGTPTMTARADSTTGRAFDHIAATVAESLGWRRL
ncbi:MAG TPA: P-loop NTPase [Gemmatimonadaceae bacterium]